METLKNTANITLIKFHNCIFATILKELCSIEQMKMSHSIISISICFFSQECIETQRTVSYRELQLLISRWGSWLTTWKDFKPNKTVVGVLAEISLDLAVAQLGTMGYGGIFSFLAENYSICK